MANTIKIEIEIDNISDEVVEAINNELTWFYNAQMNKRDLNLSIKEDVWNDDGHILYKWIDGEPRIVTLQSWDEYNPF